MACDLRDGKNPAIKKLIIISTFKMSWVCEEESTNHEKAIKQSLVFFMLPKKTDKRSRFGFSMNKGQ